MSFSTRQETVIRGVPVSPGIASGPAYLLQHAGIHLPISTISPGQIESELARLENAWTTTVQQIEMIRANQKGDERQLVNDIIDIHLMLAQDIPVYIGGRIEELVRNDLMHVETALNTALQELLERMTKSPFQRSEDVADIGHQVLSNLVGMNLDQFENIDEPVIVVADDLTPSLTVRLPQGKVLAFVTARGSRTSHTAIMARAAQIPAIVGVPDLLESVDEEDFLIVDGDRGVLAIRPAEETVQRYRRIQEEAVHRIEALEHFRDLDPETTDAFTVPLAANIELPEEVISVKQYGGHGIGLYRTEFLYMNRRDLPTEDEQFLAYRKVVEESAPDPVIIRTLDIGGDKFPSSIRMPKERNPFMGWRAIRFSLEQPEIFHTQLRAMLRASIYGNLSIMFPMISEVREMKLACAAFNQVRDQLRAEGVEINDQIQVGTMIEVPSAALVMDGLLPLADFFSIGTNDLIQYTLATDRGNERTAYLYDPLHPGVLRLIRNVVSIAHQAGKKVSVCGEMAGSIEFTLILVGLMVDELSMSPIAIPGIKRLIRSISYEEAVGIAEKVLAMNEPEEIREYLLSETRRMAPWSADLLSMDSRPASA